MRTWFRLLLRSFPIVRFGSEIRLFGHRYVVLELQVVLGANLLAGRLVDAPETLDLRPWLIEGVRVLYFDVHFQSVAVVRHLPALGHVKLVTVRGAVVIDEG